MKKKFLKNVLLIEQKTVDRSKFILKRNKKFSYQKRTKPRSMLPFQEAVGETSHKQRNLILTSLQFRKIINIHYVALKWDLKFDHQLETFPFFIAN